VFLNPDEQLRLEWRCARLIALYANLNDEARWEEVAALFAQDGVLLRPTAPDVPIAGREAILAAFRAFVLTPDGWRFAERHGSLSFGG